MSVSESDSVRVFMAAVGQEVPELPKIPDKKVLALRVRLIGEEITELFEVLGRIHDGLSHGERLGILIDLADAVADCNYVITGTAIAFGLPAHEIFEIVTAANMAKIGGPQDADGKQLKPIGWQPPEPQIKNIITNLWANAPPKPVAQTGGVEWEGEEIGSTDPISS